MNRTEVIRACCTPDERRALELLAAKERRKMSDTLREIVRLSAQQRGLWPPPKDDAPTRGGDHAA